MKSLIGLLLLITMASCSQNSDKVTSYLKVHGDCESVVDHGWVFFGCSDDDFYKNHFTCKKKNQDYKGILCAGLFKGNTIRWD